MLPIRVHKGKQLSIVQDDATGVSKRAVAASILEVCAEKTYMVEAPDAKASLEPYSPDLARGDKSVVGEHSPAVPHAVNLVICTQTVGSGAVRNFALWAGMRWGDV
jgi:hypothetical protein